MNWPIDDLAKMDDDEVSRWLAGQGLPGVRFLFWDPRERVYKSWSAATEAARRDALEAIGAAMASRT